MVKSTTMGVNRPLDIQRAEFKKRRLIAMPLAGTIIWAGIGIAGLFLPTGIMMWVIFLGTGSIVYLGIMLSRFTGENFTDKNRPKNTFDTLFFMNTGMALAVFSIAIPFFLVEPTSLPMTVGILSGLMWIPLSWIIQHWVGIFHGVGRTGMVLALWYLFPDDRFVIIPASIVIIYLITIVILEKRWKLENSL